MSKNDEFTELKRDSESLIKQASLMLLMIAEHIKSSKTIKTVLLNKLETTTSKIKRFKEDLDSINSKGESLLLDDDFLPLIEIANDYTKWMYDFTSEVMVELEELKDNINETPIQNH